jgi:hypothetical protein
MMKGEANGKGKIYDDDKNKFKDKASENAR